MQNQLNTFSFGSNPVRVVMRAGEPWWIAADVCAVLDHSNPTMALQRLDDDEKMTLNSNEGHGGQRGGAQSYSLVNESGLYSLVLGSRKPEAKAFKKWITSEVIPSIRRTGGYLVAPGFQVPKTMSEALRLAADAIEQRQALACEVQELTPKAAFHDQVVASEDVLSVAEFAKTIGTGEVRFFRWLREQGLLIPGGTLPYQRYLDQGLFRVEERACEDKRGRDRLFTKTLITGKGQVALAKRYRAQGEAGQLRRVN